MTDSGLRSLQTDAGTSSNDNVFKTWPSSKILLIEKLPYIFFLFKFFIDWSARKHKLTDVDPFSTKLRWTGTKIKLILLWFMVGLEAVGTIMDIVNACLPKDE
jgi:hypothetical protein